MISIITMLGFFILLISLYFDGKNTGKKEKENELIKNNNKLKKKYEKNSIKSNNDLSDKLQNGKY